MLTGYSPFHEEDEPESISLTPLIDTVLVLLLIFIIATPSLYNTLDIILPYGTVHGEENDEKKILCFAMDKKGTIYTKKHEQITLERAVKIISTSTKETPIILFSDKDAACGHLIEFIDTVKNLGYHNVYCKTKKISLQK